MSFKCGIVGLPNVGKSTLFNALTNSSKAQAANFPFCTIEPNVGIVLVPDERLDKLVIISKSKKKINSINQKMLKTNNLQINNLTLCTHLSFHIALLFFHCSRAFSRVKPSLINASISSPSFFFKKTNFLSFFFNFVLLLHV